MKPALFSSLTLAFLATSTLAAPPKPNIVYVLCDDLGYGDVGVFHQNERAALKDRSLPSFSTPGIDEMARQGAMLTRHYCGAPVCAPSRASFLTGRTQGHATVRDNQFDKALDDTLTVASVLKQAGYATAAIGKWGLQGGGKEASSPAQWPAYPTKRGFDDFFGYVRHVDGHFHYPKEDKGQVWENDREISSELDLCYTTDLFTARAKKWITDHRKAKSDQPFFLFLSYDTPHAVLQNPPCAFPDGGGLKGGLQWTGKPGSMINTAIGTKDDWMDPALADQTWDHDRDPSTAEVPWPISQKRYANGVRRIDQSVADLIKLLEDLKIGDNTLIVFTSDNGPSQESYLPGEPFNPNFFRGFGPFDGIKRDTLEGGLRTPTVVRWPAAIPAGRVEKSPAGQWDWLATFAEISNVPAPAISDGVSLLPLLTGKGERRDGQLYVEYQVGGKTPNYPEFQESHRGKKRGQMQAVFAAGHKGLRYDLKSAEDDFEIYNVEADPAEANNLADTPRGKEIQLNLKAKALQSRRPNPSAPRPYDEAPIPSLITEIAANPGIRASFYPGSWPWTPDFRSMKAVSTKEFESFESLKFPSEPAGVAFEGLIGVTTAGEHAFSIETDGAPTLFIHDCRLLGETAEKEGKVTLAAGWHPFRIYFSKLPAQGVKFMIRNAADGKAIENFRLPVE